MFNIISEQTETTSQNINEVVCIQLSKIIMTVYGNTMKKLFACPETVINYFWAIRLDYYPSSVHLKMEADPDTEKLWVF